MNITHTINKHRDKRTEYTQKIKPMTISDVDAVVALSRTYFPKSAECSVNTLKEITTNLYFRDGTLMPSVSPLVSRSEDGTVHGFLGVITKSFSYKDRIVSMANCHHLMATPEARKQLIPMRLLQQFLSGDQDIFFSDSSAESTRLLWKRLGGEPVIGESMYYKLPLRPLLFTARHLLKNQQNRVGDTGRRLASITNSIAEKLHIPYFHRKKPTSIFIPLTKELLGKLLTNLQPYYPLFPDYHYQDIQRLFGLIKGEERFGILQKAAVLDTDSKAIGWFIYYAKNKGVCEVVQAVSLPGKEDELFDSLAWHAFSRGGAELSGRLMPGQLKSSFTTETISLPARMWTLMKSENTELKHIFQSGQVFLTRLEGDLWVL